MQKITIAILAISLVALLIAVLALLPQLRTVNFSDVGTEESDNNTTAIEWQRPPNGKELTGNLTVYILPVTLTVDGAAQDVNTVRSIIGNVYAAFYTDLGASPKGQYIDERVTLTEQNITPDLQNGGFKVGDTVEMTVYRKPTETVKFYIDSAYTHSDGVPITRVDLPQDYSFGNGITCCGFSLADGSDRAGVIIVTDWAYDEYMIDRIDELKKALGTDERTTITVEVGEEPQQSLIQRTTFRQLPTEEFAEVQGGSSYLRYLYPIGIGAAIAAVIAFFTLRRRR